MEKFDVTARLEMIPHPAGGYYKESYTSIFSLTNESNPNIPKPMASSIFYLLGNEDSCLFHSSSSEEVWSFLYGYPIDLYLISPKETLSIITIGSNLSLGETPQFTIPPNQIFGMKLHGHQKPGHSFLTYSPEAFALLSCLSVPGFIQDSVRYFTQEEIMSKYPNCKELETFCNSL
jgi:predicted cupin superfamily sugar epimerase